MRNLPLLLLSIVLFFSDAWAETLKGKLSVRDGALVPGDFTIVAQDAQGALRNAAVGADGKFSISDTSGNARLSLLYRSNFYSPVVLALRKGKAIKHFRAAVNSGLCGDGTARAVIAYQKLFKKSLALEVDAALGIGYAKKVNKKQKKLAAKGASAAAGSDCLVPGISESAELQQVTLRADVDGDGTEDESDLDDDDDGVADAFDADNDNDGIIDDADGDSNDQNTETQLFYFQQLHLDRSDSFHPKLQVVTTEMIDDALREFGGLAIEVKDGTSVELDCGGTQGDDGQGLPWCTTGGTGRSKEPYPDGLKFPEELDADSDGKAEISAGPSGDLQLAPNAASDEIQPGDTFIEEVTDSTGTLTKFIGVLNSVVQTVPGIVSITTEVDEYTFDYPASLTSVGTFANPLMVPPSGDVLITVTSYPPVYLTKAGRVVPGILTFTTQIPNGPCTYDDIAQICNGSGNGPGLLPGTLYSNPSSGWEIASDGVRSNTTDRIVEQSDTVTYTVNLTGDGGVADWDPGEYLRVPIQAMDANGTTSAHNVIFRREEN